MKKTFFSFLLLFCGLFAQAQYVNIPDVNFRTFLRQRYPACFNTQGLMDTTCTAITTARNIDCSNRNIGNLQGIQYFRGLDTLVCSNNQLTNLNIQGLTNLQNLACGFNQLTSLNMQGLVNLQNLNCGINRLTNLNVQGLTNLQNLTCLNNQLTSLNMQGSANLQQLNCDNNQLTSLNLQGLTNLQNLYSSSNQLTSINVQGLTNLQNIYCAANQLQSLNVQGLTSLQGLYFSDNFLSSLNVQGLTNLHELSCASNPIFCLSILPDLLTFLNTNGTNITCLSNIPAGIIPSNHLSICQPNNLNGCAFVATETLAAENPIVSLVPNPMHDFTTISYQQSYRPLEGVGNLNLTLYNTLGQVLKTQKFTGETLILQRDELPAGCYFYSIRNGSELVGQGRLMME